MSGNAPALDKGLKILEYLLAANEPGTLSSIAAGVGFKVSEIQRMVEYLARERYLVKTQAGAYTAGARAYALADLGRENAIISRAEGALRRYSLETEASVHLGVLVERMLHVVYDIEGRGTVRISIKPGLYDAEENASGRLLLAYGSGGLRNGEEGETSASAEADAARIVRQGYAMSELRCARGIYAIAVPVAFGQEPCAAAIASPYALRESDASPLREDILEGLRKAAREIAAMF
jgi:DNA-binding IclR family transcriptional regulator